MQTKGNVSQTNLFILWLARQHSRGRLTGNCVSICGGLSGRGYIRGIAIQLTNFTYTDIALKGGIQKLKGAKAKRHARVLMYLVWWKLVSSDTARYLLPLKYFIINKAKLSSGFSNVEYLDFENCSSFNSKHIYVIKRQTYIKWPGDFNKM